LREIGLVIEPAGNDLIAVGQGNFSSSNCSALPYPGLPTDLQAQLTAWLAIVPGQSRIVDDVFPDRFMHVSELVRMGARIRRESLGTAIEGVERLQGACVMVSDLRAGAALVLAALAAEGESVIRRIYHLDRGYDALDRKLASLGARIRRVQDSPEQLPAALKPQALKPQFGSVEISRDEARTLRLDPAQPLNKPHDVGVDVTTSAGDQNRA
jgi:UDP-N-acetylglucosamine 1-carboxyvinyltransferase